jgi:hypothetical protein
MINFTADKRFIAIWFVPHGQAYPFNDQDVEEGVSRNCDWLAGAWINEDGTLEIQYRFHYFSDDPAVEGERNWFRMSGEKTAEEEDIQSAMNTMTKLAEMCAARNGSEMHIVKCDLCNGEEAVQLMQAQSWFHLKNIEPS